MNILNEIPVQWLLMGLSGLIALQTFLMLKMISKLNRKIDGSFLVLEKRIKKSVESASQDVTRQVELTGSLQNESIQTVEAKLSEIESKSPARVTQLNQNSTSPLERKHQVVSLAQMGMDSKGISRRLRLSRGEAELLLGLKERYSTETEDDHRTLQ